MGFHIPDSPRSRSRSHNTQSETVSVEAQSVSVSVGTSTANDEDETSPPPPSPLVQLVNRPRRRNAMTPILIMELMAAQDPDGAAPTDPVQALLQFQAQLRSRGLLPPDDQAPKHPTASVASDAGW